jgi:anti-anti-sigma factor
VSDDDFQLTLVIWTDRSQAKPFTTILSSIIAITERSHAMTPCAADSNFDARIEWGEDVVRVTLCGELVYETLVPLQSRWESVRGQPRPTVVLDLSEVTFLASGPLGSILELRRWLMARGQRLCISGLSWQVREVLRVTGLTKILSIDDEAIVTTA